jgi:hypothetical protein
MDFPLAYKMTSLPAWPPSSTPRPRTVAGAHGYVSTSVGWDIVCSVRCVCVCV